MADKITKDESIVFLFFFGDGRGRELFWVVVVVACSVLGIYPVFYLKPGVTPPPPSLFPSER